MALASEVKKLFAAHFALEAQQRIILMLAHAQMLLADLVGGEQADEGHAGSGLFDVGAAAGFFALHQAEHANNVEAKFARRSDGLNRGGAGSANVIHDEDFGAFFAEALNALLHAVGLIRLAHQEAIELEIFADGAGTLGGASLNALRAQHGHRRHNRIGAQGEPAYRLRLRAAVVDFLVKHPAHQARALAAQGGGAAINVVVAGAAGGELELAQMERL